MWSPLAELNPGDEYDMSGADPGKDLFALLALTFLVVTVLFMLAARFAESPLPVDTASRSAEAHGPPPPPAAMRGGEHGVTVVQGERSWTLPAQAAEVAREAALHEVPGQPPALIVDPPGADLGADQLVLSVQALNAAGVRVRFRVVTGAGATP